MPSVCAPRMSSGKGSTSWYALAWSASRPTCGPLPCEITSWCSPASGAIAAAATVMLCCCASAVIGSPRLSSAFPPSAMRILTGSRPEGRDHHGLDGVQPVLGLVEHDGALRLEHLIGDLEPVEPEPLEDVLADDRVTVVERRKAVQELHVRVAGAAKQLRVHLVRPQQADALLPHGRVFAHRDPDVGVQVVDAGDALVGVVGDRQAGAGLLRDAATRLDEVRLGPEVLRCGEPHVHAELAAADHERVAHVVPRVAE